jgi:hypothetical protein
MVFMAGLTVRSYKTSYYLIEVVSMAGLTVRSHNLQSNLP